MKKTCAVLIPYFNEKERISAVLDQIIQVKNLSEIICVDGASTDGTSDFVRKKYPQVKIIRLEKCQGKTEAIAASLAKINADYIFLCDADLRDLRVAEVDNAVNAILTNANIDMIIMRRIYSIFSTRLSRSDILFTGERILRKKDLIEILKTNPQGYQLEIAINKYMADHNKIIYWMLSSALSTFKVKKVGIFTGLINELNMILVIIKFAGLKEYLRQILFFCHNKYSF